MEIFAETERLILRALLPIDAEMLFELDSDIDVHQYLGRKPVKSIHQSISDIEFIRKQYIDNGIGRWAVIEKESGQFIGWGGLKFITETCNNQINYYDLGYRFIKRYWGKGYATETAKASLKYGFQMLNVPKIIAIADVENNSSIKVLEKAGLRKIETFNYDGRLHHWMKIDRSSYY